jgi:hypothetical protein
MGFLKDLFAAPAPRQETHQAEGWRLKQGTQIQMADVDPEFVERARANYPRKPQLGHVVPVAVGLAGGKIVVWFDGHQVAQMHPDAQPMYMDEFRTLTNRGQVGLTDAYIKAKDMKSAHSLALNWGRGAYDGGIL